MINFSRWFWAGLLTTTVLAFIAIWVQGPQIESDLGQKAQSALNEDGFDWAQVTMSGRDATITGQAPDEDSAEIADLIVDEVYDVRVVDNQTTLAAVQSPYVTSFARTADTLSVTGFVPNGGARSAMLDAVNGAMSDLSVEDNTEIGRGAPETFDSQADMAAKLLPLLQSGKVNFSDATLSMDGVAKDVAAYDRLQAIVTQDLPEGITLADNTVTAPAPSPYSLDLSVEGGVTKLSGYAPSAEARQALESELKARYHSDDVTTSIRLAEGAPEDFEAKANVVLEQGANLASGQVSLAGNEISVEGTAKDQSAYEALQSLLVGDLPAGLERGTISVMPPLADPYLWSLVRSATGVEISGHVPDAQTREALVEAVRAIQSDVAINDQSQFASGADEQFEARARFMAEQIGKLKAGSISLANSQLSIDGEALTPASHAQLARTFSDSLPHGLELADTDIKLAKVSPYEWSAQRTGEGIALRGHVPDEATRSALLKRAGELNAGLVSDNMTLAGGAPANFAGHADFALEQLSALSSGTAELVDGSLNLQGIAAQVGGLETIRSALGSGLPEGLSIGQADLEPASAADYVWTAELQGTTVTLGGVVPDANTRGMLVERAQSMFPDARIVDEMVLATGAPAQFAERSAFALNRLRRLESGRADLSGPVLTMNGQAQTHGSYTELSTSSSDLPAGLELDAKGVVPALAQPYTWAFERGEKVLRLSGFVPSEEARQRLNNLLEARYPGLEIADSLQIASGAPDNFQAMTKIGLDIADKLKSGGVSLQDGAMRLVGEAKTDEDYAELKQVLDDGSGINLEVAANSIQPPPAPKDYVFSAQRTGGSIILSGNAPSLEVRRELGDAARAAITGADIVNRVVPRADAPDGFREAALDSISQLSRLSSGTASLRNSARSISGVAASPEDYRDLSSITTSDSDERYNWVSSEIEPASISPYVWTVRRTGADVNLSGFAPDRAAIETWNTAAGQAFSGTVKNDQLVASGAPEGLLELGGKAIAAVAQLKGGFAELRGAALVVGGEAESEEQAAEFLRRLQSSATASLPIVSELSWPEPKREPEAAPEPVVEAQPAMPSTPEARQCQVDFNALLAEEKIEFATNRALINVASHDLLNRLAQASRTCPDARFEVGGHTDSRGADDYNQQLSEARAQSVTEFLVRAGIADDKISAIGYGETRPVGDNETVEGRSANRRIEIRVFDQ